MIYCSFLHMQHLLDVCPSWKRDPSSVALPEVSSSSKDSGSRSLYSFAKPIEAIWLPFWAIWIKLIWFDLTRKSRQSEWVKGKKLWEGKNKLKQKLTERQNKVKKRQGQLVFTSNNIEISPISTGCTFILDDSAPHALDLIFTDIEGGDMSLMQQGKKAV